MLKSTWLRDEAGVAQAEVVQHDATDVAARDRAVLVAEHVVHERVAVDRVRGDVVEVVGREARVAVAAEVGRDHLEAGGGERPDVAPPDALGLRVAVQQAAAGCRRRPSRTYAMRHAVADLGVVRSANFAGSGVVVTSRSLASRDRNDDATRP